MPIYEYECKKCGLIFEHSQKISEPNLTQCKECDGEVQKIISQSSFHLKGSGWYVTDYAGKKSGSVSSSTPDTASKDTASKPATEGALKETKTSSEPAKETKAA